MTLRLRMTAVLALIGLVLVSGCYNPLQEKLHARRALAAKDYPTAEQKLDGVIDRNPSDWEAHYLRGKVYLATGRALEAQTELEKALAVKNRSQTHTPKILDALAESLLLQDKDEALYAFLDEQIQRYEGWQDYARKARLLARSNDADGAALAYQQAALFSRDEDSDIYVEIADFYMGRGDQDRAYLALRWAYYIDNERTDLRQRFETLGYVFGPTLKDRPPQPLFDGQTFKLPRLID